MPNVFPSNDSLPPLSTSISSLPLREMRELLVKCASTALNSKLIAGQKGFFSEMVVDAVMSLDELLPLKMIGIKKVQGGALEVRSTPGLLSSSHHLHNEQP